MELHDDAVFTEKHLRKYRTRDGEERTATKRRKSDFQVFKSVANAYERKLCQRIELPPEIKNLLRCPKDEGNWSVLQKVRDEIALLVQGLKKSTLDTEEEIHEFAAALSSATAADSCNTIGEAAGPWIPKGARLHLNSKDTEHIEGDVHMDSRQGFLVAKVRRFEVGTVVHVLTMPFGTALAPPAEPFADLTADKKKTLKDIASRAKPAPLKEGDPQAILDRMLLVLRGALHFDACLRWTKQKVANLPIDRTLDIARCFVSGLDASSKEDLFTGLCAMCTVLLYGPAGGKLSNCKSGRPIDKDGSPLHTTEGAPDIHVQPPYFLRFSPHVFAEVRGPNPSTGRSSTSPGLEDRGVPLGDRGSVNGSRKHRTCLNTIQRPTCWHCIGLCCHWIVLPLFCHWIDIVLDCMVIGLYCHCFVRRPTCWHCILLSLDCIVIGCHCISLDCIGPPKAALSRRWIVWLKTV